MLCIKYQLYQLFFKGTHFFSSYLLLFYIYLIIN